MLQGTVPDRSMKSPQQPILLGDDRDDMCMDQFVKTAFISRLPYALLPPKQSSQLQAKTLRGINLGGHDTFMARARISARGNIGGWKKQLGVAFLTLKEMVSENLRLLSLSGLNAECGVRTPLTWPPMIRP